MKRIGLSTTLVLAVVLTLALLALAPAQGSTAATAPSAGLVRISNAPHVAAAPAMASMTVGISAEPAGLDPALVDYDPTAFFVTSQVYETLVTVEPDTALALPGLAQSWSVSADGLTWTFTLRTGVTFHDGTALNAAAVRFNLERWWDPAHPYHNGDFAYFDYLFGGFRDDPTCLITDISSTGTSQVRITLRHAYSPLPSMLATPWFAIASPTAIQAGTLDHHPVGTGPFRFGAWTAGDSIRLDAAAAYRGPASRVSPLTFKILPDPAARLAALQANTIQVVADLPIGQLPAVVADPRLRVAYRPASSVGYVGINRSHAGLDNPLVRRAIAHAMNKPAVLASHYAANAQVATQLLPPGMWGRDPGIVDYTHDVALARSLLTQAGYPNGFSTTLALRDVVRDYLPDPIGTANAIHADLAAAGIQAEVLVYDSPTFLAKLANGELDLYLLGWYPDYPHPANYLDTLFCQYSSDFGPRDEMLCQAMERALAATSLPAQLTEYQWASRRVHDTLPMIPLAHARSMRVERRDVLGIQASPLGYDDYAMAGYTAARRYLPLVMR